MSNFGLYKALDKAGIEYEQTKVGDKYVYENMVQNGHRIGGEQSGHIIFTKYATTGDGILTSLKMMEVMLAKEKPMSELAAPVVFYPQVLKNVRVRASRMHRTILMFRRLLKKLPRPLAAQDVFSSENQALSRLSV